jgi:hypothetical protein
MELDSALLHTAAVVLRYVEKLLAKSTVEQWVTETLGILPGARLIAVAPRLSSDVTLFLRDGGWAQASVLDSDQLPFVLDPAVTASAVYAWTIVHDTRAKGPVRFTLGIGKDRYVVVLTGFN